jgi:peptidoglycan/LPS O-acetylase OafA/YrhL
VPFFFLASGFLLGQKINPADESGKIRQVVAAYLRRIIKLYLTWSVIYLPLALCEFVPGETSAVSFAAVYLFKLLFVGEHYNSWMLWYLLAVIYALLLLLLLMHLRVSKKWIYAIAIFFILIVFGINALQNYVGEGVLPYVLELCIANSRLLSGFFYLLTGMLLAEKEVRPEISFLLLAAGFCWNLLAGAEPYSMPVAICAVGLFCIAKQMKCNDSSVYVALRRMSTVIYLIHMYVWTGYYRIRYGEKTFGMECFLVTSVISVVCAILYVRKENHSDGRNKKAFCRLLNRR